MSNKNRNTEENRKNINNKNVKKTNNGNKGKAKKKKRTVFKKIMYILLLLLIVFGAIFTYKVYQNGGGISGIIAAAVGHDKSTKENLEDFKCLLLGISTDQENVFLTDTIMVASYNPNTQKATLMSVPRDTFTGSNPSRATAYEKINALYSRKNRPDETLEAVNEITGLDIKYYAVLKTEALIELVDLVGGVTFDVPIDMKYTDTNQKLYIDLKAGKQVLNGDKAEQLLRFRKNNNGTTYPEEYGSNDTGRMRTQREFIEATASQMLKPENLFKVNKIIEVAKKNIITNVDFDYAKDYMPYALEFDINNLQTATLPGTNTNKNTSGTWVYVVNEKETEEMIKELFVQRDIVKEVDGIDISNIELDVLNGTGMNSKSDEIVEKLEMAGYEINSQSNTSTIEKTTIVCSSELDKKIIENFQIVLGLTDIVVSNTDKDLSNLKIKLIVGEDYIK